MHWTDVPEITRDTQVGLYPAGRCWIVLADLPVRYHCIATLRMN
jgi:hypothetical protein